MLNHTFNTTITIRGEEFSNFAGFNSYSPRSINLDHSQVFNKVNLLGCKKIGMFYSLNTEDFVTIKTNNLSNTYKMLDKKYNKSFIDVNLKDIFEDLNVKSLTSIDENQTIIVNPILSEFVDVSNQLLNPNLTTVLRMLVKLVSGNNPSIINQNVDCRTYTGTIINDFYDTIALNPDLLDWAVDQDSNPIELDSFLSTMQKAFCFTIHYDYALNTLNIESLPIMKVEANVILDTNFYRDPVFFQSENVNGLLDPTLSSDLSTKIYGTDGLNNLNKILNPVNVFGKSIIGETEVQIDYFKYNYRDDIKPDDLEIPTNLYLEIDSTFQVVNPLVFSFSLNNHVLKVGYYHSYKRYFTYQDIGQNNPKKLNGFFNLQGYRKDDKIIAEEDNVPFTDLKQPRSIVFENDVIKIVTNKPILSNLINT